MLVSCDRLTALNDYIPGENVTIQTEPGTTIKTFPAPLELPLSEWLLVDVTTAEKLLGYNDQNRNRRKQHVDALSHDMASGNWKPNGETVKVAYNGRLLDGQHRLESLIDSNKSQLMLVVMGLPEESQDTVDTGLKRSFADVLKIRGYGNHMVRASIVRQTFLWDRGERRNITHGKIMPTTTELLNFMREHPELDDVVNYTSWVYSHFKAMPPSVIGLCAWLFDQVGEDGERSDFFARLIEGSNMEKEHPIMKLRHLLLQRSRSVSFKLRPEMKLALTIKAWNHYREGSTVEMLVWKAGGVSPEAFPEPR